MRIQRRRIAEAAIRMLNGASGCTPSFYLQGVFNLPGNDTRRPYGLKKYYKPLATLSNGIHGRIRM
jgi:hypothetical protein